MLPRFIQVIGMLAVVAAMAVAARPAAAQGTLDLIQEIAVQGNQRIEAETVRSYLAEGGIEVGAPFDRQRIDQGFKSLFATGLFADINLRREGSALVVSVVENPIINRLAFEGNRRISDEVLSLEVRLRPRVVYTFSTVQSDVARIIEVYRRSGRFAATVEPKVIQQAQNRVDLVFEIDEGPLTGIRKISFIGNRRISDGTLKGKILTKESRWYCLTCYLTTDDAYDPDRLAFDREVLRRFYRSKGYADFRVVSVVAELTRDRSGFFVTFTLEEGERYRIGAVKIENSIRGLEVESLFGEIRTETGELYNDTDVEDTIQRLTSEIGRAGFAFVDVQRSEERDRDNRTIDITFKIGVGARAYVERINITGNSKTRDEVIRREFRLVEGDAFNSAKLRRSEQRIRNLGFFQNVAVARTRGSSPDQVVIDLDVTEKQTGAVELRAGFSSFEGPLADISISEQNLLGRGQRLSLAFSVSGRRKLLDLNFAEPYFLGRNLLAGVRAFGSITDVSGEDEFQRTALGTEFRVSYPLAPWWRHSAAYGLERIDIGDVSGSSSPFIVREEGVEVTSFVRQGLQYDRRDSRFDPTEGFFIRLDQKFAGVGGDVSYLKHVLSGAYYYPITETFIGSLSGTLGHVFDFSGGEVGIGDRFFITERVLRGFDSGGVGPRDACTDQALGGNTVANGSVEVRFPLGLPEALQFSGRVFTDFGTLTGVDQKDPKVKAVDLLAGGDCVGIKLGAPRLLDEASLRASVGVGVSFLSPLGLWHLDYAFPILKEDFDETKNFTFAFGTRF